MMERKYCPLCFANSESEANLFCEKEKCEWWNNGECCVNTAVAWLADLAKVIKQIIYRSVDDGK